MIIYLLNKIITYLVRVKTQSIADLGRVYTVTIAVAGAGGTTVIRARCA